MLWKSDSCPAPNPPVLSLVSASGALYVPCVVTLKLTAPRLASVAEPVLLPDVQLWLFQSSRVVPTGQTNVGGVPATRAPTVKLTAL